MVKITILGSCRFSPYVVLAAPDPLNPKYTVENHHEFNTDAEYVNACKKFYPAIDESDIIIVWAPDGVGDHTTQDIEYADKQGKRVILIGPDGVHTHGHTHTVYMSPQVSGTSGDGGRRALRQKPEEKREGEKR